MSTDVPVRQCTCSVYFLFFGITRTMTFQLIHWGTYRHIHPKRNVPVYPHAFLWSNNKDLPVSTTTCVHAHRCTRSRPYLAILIQSFGYPLSSIRPRFCCSTFPQTYLFINIPVRFISYFSAYPTQRPFNSSTGVPTHRSTRKYIYLFTFMLLFRLTIKTYLSPQLLVYLPIFVPVHGPTCSF